MCSSVMKKEEIGRQSMLEEENNDVRSVNRAPEWILQQFRVQIQRESATLSFLRRCSKCDSCQNSKFVFKLVQKQAAIGAPHELSLASHAQIGRCQFSSFHFETATV